MRLSSLLASLLSLFLIGSLAACSGAQKPATTDGAEASTEASATTEATPEATTDTPAAAPTGDEALISNGKLATPEILLGGQPSYPEMEALHKAGYLTMISLQTHSEEGVPETLGDGRAVFGSDAVIHLPVGGIPGVTLENATKLGEQLTAAKERGGKVLLHCRSGGRAAALWALSRHQSEGLSAEQTLQAAKDAGLTNQALLDHLAELLEE